MINRQRRQTKSNRAARVRCALIAAAVASFSILVGCASQPTVSLSTLEVSAQRLRATATRGSARVTYEAERGLPIDEATSTWKRDPEIDPPGQSATLLCDRRGHVLSIAGGSFEHPGEWEARQQLTPTRTKRELAEDLAVARSLPDLLMNDSRVREWFRWEIRLLRNEISELQRAQAPTGE